MSFAIITISGNITRDAEVVNFSGDRSGVKFGIAVNDSKTHTSFYDVVFTDEYSVKFLLEKGLKGSAIVITGDLVINKKETTTFVNVYGRSVVELFNRTDNSNKHTGSASTPATESPATAAPVKKERKPLPPPPVEMVDDTDDDFPF